MQRQPLEHQFHHPLSHRRVHLEERAGRDFERPPAHFGHHIIAVGNGKRGAIGPPLFNRPNSRFFKQEHVQRAHLFFERYGPKTIVLARFIPIVRTFAPIVAGVSKMRYRTFFTYNLIGAALWAGGVTTAGYFLGQIDIVKNNIEIALILVVLLSLIPVAIELLRQRRHAKELAAASSTTPPR